MRATQTNTFLSFVTLSFFSFANANNVIEKRAPPPTNLANGYVYQGCYIDIGRSLNDAVLIDATLTNQKCTAFCFSKGFKYAGSEYYQECYCGNTLPTGANKVAEGDCSTPCNGDANQPCGGPNRLTVYKTNAGPGPNPGVNGYGYQGCLAEGTNGRSLTTQIFSVPVAEMTIAKCVAACKAQNFKLAGAEYSGECYCGNAISNGGVMATSGCDMTCNGNTTEYCGGANRLSLYDSTKGSIITGGATGGASSTTSTTTSTTTTRPTTTTTTTAQPTSSGSPGFPAKVGTWNLVGCRSEAGNGARALSVKQLFDATMTLEKCATFCAGSKYFGTEYTQECYCGDDFKGASAAVALGDCNMNCGGNAAQKCGGPDRLTVYTSGAAPPGGTTSNPTTSTSTTTTRASTTTNPPAASGFPAGFTNQGCWVDKPGRILPIQLADDPQLTQQKCAQACAAQGYTISGTEYYTQCFCGNNLINDGVKATNQADCNTPCGGNTAQMCGGPDRMTIYSNGTPTVKGSPAPQKDVPGWTYQGCVTDNMGEAPNQRRTFYWQTIMKNLTPTQCLTRCRDFGYAAAGIEYGEECFCGDAANIPAQGATFRPEAECNVLCPGDGDYICGGGNRMSTYYYTGTAARPVLYSWGFPNTAATAGKFDFLIGGVCIPLMVQESINGKITFLEKFGTGPDNSTGAYELDLSQINDFARAWKTMHVKTDIFCSAGVILPDKAGRQLNVGGWAKPSTEGIRLYTPSGSDGVKGATDWEEDVNALKLQDGRWYPTAMIMANGSILVVGGEEGSNGAAVPTLEILPSTGTKPLYMDWLARTDPNNLYPFLAVLPSGGIFVAYWNEARILSASTFATIKTLPNIPGAVNDDRGGRTYPLEGTAVLMPQRYPYNENIRVLICGGSTIGPAWALDNCVSTAPDDANPTWTLERMPSRRVMSCIAPLPDGTYLILNGAQHGVAGFGLADTPNYNAVLYDPTKPVHQRMTVMANSTVIRFYHSEAITLLDGRVLVSGSDPEDGKNPQEYRIETFSPPYLTSGKARPTLTSIANKDWAYGQQITFNVGGTATGDISVTLLGAVSSTHGNSMGARTIMPQVTCNGGACTVTAPPNANICPPGWFQFFVVRGGVPAKGVYVRIGGDPAGLGNWPQGAGFSRPGMGAYTG